MSFLLPIFWGAMALAGAIVVFYLIREKPRKRLLSTLLFWEQLHAKVYETPLWRKLRRWVSLLLQILFLALLVFALARPVADWEMSGVRSRVLVLDPSASMSATDAPGSRFQAAKGELRAQIRRMRFFDEAALVLASDPPEILSGWTRSRRRLLDALELARPGNVDSDPRPALELARNLASTRERAAVEFYSDGVFAKAPDAKLLAGIVERRFGGSEPANAGLSLFAARRSLVAPGEFSLMVRADAAGSKPVRGEVEILRDEVLIDAQSVEIKPGDGWHRSWDLRGDAGGKFTARLKGGFEDRLAQDDEATVTVAPLRAVDVVIVSPPDNFVEAVFRAMPGVNVSRVWPSEQAGKGDPGKLWVFNHATPPADFQSMGLVLLAPEKGGMWGERKGKLADPIISDVDGDSPLMRFAALDKVRVGEADEFAAPQGARAFASSFGKPVVLGRWDRNSHWLVIAFDLAQSDFVLRTAFPILMENAVQSLRGNSDAMVAALPGSTETRLAPHPVSAAPHVEPQGWSAPWTVRPLWWWALLAGALWLLAEWWTYHRRITE